MFHLQLVISSIIYRNPAATPAQARRKPVANPSEKAGFVGKNSQFFEKV